ncbi:MAG TPA: carbohydrate kinase family protein [Ardenticatenaceae bacterium]|nr:carbohydrate kinase family protein [Ardenticatenaceae bacterium]
MAAEDARILVVGAAGLDIKAQTPVLLEHGVSVPGQIHLSLGGSGRNIAENLARLELETLLFSVVGDDPAGRYLVEATGRVGVDVGQVLLSKGRHHTGAYLAMRGPDGDTEWALDDMEIMELISPEYIDARRALFPGANTIVLDMNVPPPTVRAIYGLARQYGITVCADPTSRHLAARLLPYLEQTAIITPNQSEAEVLCGCTIRSADDAAQAALQLVAQGVGLAIITLGDRGLVYASDEERGHIPALEVEAVDVTGIGDALTATVVFGLINGFPVDEAIRLGVTAAALTLTCPESVCPDLSLERLYDKLML